MAFGTAIFLISVVALIAFLAQLASNHKIKQEELKNKKDKY